VVLWKRGVLLVKGALDIYRNGLELALPSRSEFVKGPQAGVS
jgi:hypothetical protein